jgi:hypothetical protein
MNVLITLTTAGADTGPFNLYSNTDSYVTAFATSIAKSVLVAGYTSTVVPAGTNTIRVKSTGTCTNYVDLVVAGATPTTTTTTTPTPTTTTTTTAGGGTTTTTTTGGGSPTTTTTTTSPTTTTTTTPGPTTTTTTTSILNSCQEWRNDNLTEVTITYTPCGSGTPVSNYALATTSSVCAVYGSITVTAGDPLTLVGLCDAPTTTTTTTTAPTPTTTTTTTVAYRSILLSNPPGEATPEGACAIESGLTKYISASFAITNGLIIYNDTALTSQTYTSDPYSGNYAMLYDTNNALRYAVTFDGSGIVNTVVNCSSPTTTTTTTSAGTTTTTSTTTTAPPPSYYAFSLTAGGIDSATACADSSAAVTLYGSSISFLSNGTFYNDYTLLSPFDGMDLYYKNVANNEYVQISSIGGQTAGGSC